MSDIIAFDPIEVYLKLTLALSGSPPVVTSTFADGVIPMGIVDGSNTSFTLPQSPNPVESLILAQDGILLRNGVGYVLSDANLSMANPPIADLIAWYRY